MRVRLLFLHTSGSSGVLKALVLERNEQLSCNPQRKKKEKKNISNEFMEISSTCHAADSAALGRYVEDVTAFTRKLLHVTVGCLCMLPGCSHICHKVRAHL